MKTTLYYFTGTGNSLWFAKQLQSHIAECEIKAIAKAIDEGDLVAPEGRVGFVTPLYFYGLPEIVMRFIKQSDPCIIISTSLDKVIAKAFKQLFAVLFLCYELIGVSY